MGFGDVYKRQLVVGAGEVATRKIMLLLQAGAQVSVVSPELDTTLKDYLVLGKIQFCAESFQPKQLENICLLYTSDAADERSSVDLGGRRIIKKNKKKK